MKKFSLSIALSALMCGAVVINAQAQEDTPTDGALLIKAINKSNADIQHPKKQTKAGVWEMRAETFIDAASAPAKGLYADMDMADVISGHGELAPVKETFDNVEYETLTYPDFKAYFTNKKLVMWQETQEIVPNALAIAAQAYMKAYELNPKIKVSEGLNKIAQMYKEDGGNFYAFKNYKRAAKSFRNSFDVMLHPTLNIIDTVTLFNVGFLYTITKDFENGRINLEDALKYNYDKEGETFYYLFHCYYGLNNMEMAKKVLLDGIAKYPNNNHIVEGLLGVFSNGDGDPSQIIPYVEKAIASDPKNAELWSGLGRIYDKLGNIDKSIESLVKAIELNPADFSSNFNLGLIYAKKGDQLVTELNQKPFTSQKEYDAELAEIQKVYMLGIVPLEAAHKASPQDVSTVELLKNVCFRLRDREGVMDKYNKYNDMLTNMKK